MAKTTGIAQFSTGRSEVNKVDPRLLVIDPSDDYREMNAELEAHIDMLAQSIAEIGVKKPIEVKLEDGKLIVKEGRCRTRAAMRAIEHYKADVKAVPVIAVDRYANDADLILNQIIGNSGKSFTTMEQAKIFKKLLDMGWNQGDIAKKVGMSGGRVSQILDLLTMPTAVQTLVATGAVSASLAQQTVKAAETPAAASQALQDAVNAAAEAGRTKAKPSDIPSNVSKTPTLKECFEASEIDNSDADSGFVLIKMPNEEFEVIRKMLGL